MENNKNYKADFPNFEEFVSSFDKNDSTSFNNNFDTNLNSSNVNQNNPFGNIDMNTILKMRQIMENIKVSSNDPRSNLLLSLKPYLKPSRKQKIDQYIQLFSMSNIIENLKTTGGEDVK